MVKKAGVTIIVDRVKELKDSINSLASQRVFVGIPAAKAGREETEGKPINNATLGYIHEFGAPEANIPARPFLIPGVKNAQKETVVRLRQAGKAALEGRKADVDKALNAAGLGAQNSVRRKITEGPFVPLKPATLAARRRKGRKGTKPLIDTTQLRSAISYVIGKR